MVRTFCMSGEREVVKGAVHAAGGALAGLMAVYNIAAWCYRRERHLGVNAVIYTVAIVWEIQQTSRHFGRCTNASAPESLQETALGRVPLNTRASR